MATENKDQNMELIAASAALSFLNAVMPLIQEKMKSGEVSPEEQQKLMDGFNELKAKVEAAGLTFEGPEWQVVTAK
jgi:hypothetical protein